MKRLLFVLALAGCNATPGSSPTPNRPQPVKATATPVPVAAASATPEATPTVAAPKSNLDEVIRLARQSTWGGLTNQARAEMLLSHLIAAGKERLLVTWEIYPEGIGVFDVTYTIEPLSRLTTPTPSATPARKSPFDRPPRRKTSGIRLTWTYDTRKGTCVPKDDRTRALLDLKPSLEAPGLERVLPVTWRSSTTVEPPTLVAEETPPPPPPSDEDASLDEAPIQFSGFLGSDKERRAALTQNGQTYTVGAGDRIGEVIVKGMEDDELELEFRGQTVRLMPGANWTPGKL